MKNYAEKIIVDTGKRLDIDLLTLVQEAINKNSDGVNLIAEHLIKDPTFNVSKEDQIVWLSDKPEEGPWPPLLMYYDNYLEARSKKGKEFIEYIEYLLRVTEQIGKTQDDVLMSFEMIEYGFYGYGMEMSEYTMEFLSIPDDLETDTSENALLRINKKYGANSPKAKLSKSIRKSITKTGRTKITITIITIISKIIWWLLSGNVKQILGLVCNLSERKLYTRNWQGDVDSDVYMKHGKMKSYMSVLNEKNLALPAIKEYMIEVVEELGLSKPVWTGGFFMEKRFGTFGAEGIFVLRTQDTHSFAFAVMGACPYYNNNRTDIQYIDNPMVVNKDWLEKNFREMYENDLITNTVVVTRKSPVQTYELYCRLGSKKTNAESGGETAIMASLKDEKMY